MTNVEITDQLKKASEGLLWMSESEYPFEVFLWEEKAPVTPEKVILSTGHSSGILIQTTTVDEFFRWACSGTKKKKKLLSLSLKHWWILLSQV